MPNLAANLSMMFNEVPFLDRFGAARAAGFRAVEFLFPYDHEPEMVAGRLQAKLQVIARRSLAECLAHQALDLADRDAGLGRQRLGAERGLEMQLHRLDDAGKAMIDDAERVAGADPLVLAVMADATAYFWPKNWRAACSSGWSFA